MPHGLFLFVVRNFDRSYTLFSIQRTAQRNVSVDSVIFKLRKKMNMKAMTGNNIEIRGLIWLYRRGKE